MTTDHPLTDVNISQTNIPSILIQDFVAKRKHFEAAEEEAKAAEKEYREVEEVLWELLETMGVPSLRIEGLGTCTKTLKGPYCSIDKETDPMAEVKVKAWLEELGLYNEIYRFAPQMSALNPIVKEMREKGEPITPALKITEHRRIQVLPQRTKKAKE